MVLFDPRTRNRSRRFCSNFQTSVVLYYFILNINKTQKLHVLVESEVQCTLYIHRSLISGRIIVQYCKVSVPSSQFSEQYYSVCIIKSGIFILGHASVHKFLISKIKYLCLNKIHFCLRSHRQSTRLARVQPALLLSSDLSIPMAVPSAGPAVRICRETAAANSGAGLGWRRRGGRSRAATICFRKFGSQE